MTKLILKLKQVVQYLDSLVVKKRWINMIGKHTKLSHPLCLPAIYGVTLLLRQYRCFTWNTIMLCSCIRFPSEGLIWKLQQFYNRYSTGDEIIDYNHELCCLNWRRDWFNGLLFVSYAQLRSDDWIIHIIVYKPFRVVWSVRLVNNYKAKLII